MAEYLRKQMESTRVERNVRPSIPFTRRPLVCSLYETNNSCYEIFFQMQKILPHDVFKKSVPQVMINSIDELVYGKLCDNFCFFRNQSSPKKYFSITHVDDGPSLSLLAESGINSWKSGPFGIFRVYLLWKIRFH